MSLRKVHPSRTNEAFSFGRNWNSFVRQHYSDDRVAISRQHLLEFIGVTSLEGTYFLDVGCGSGLSSLAAFRAGAKRIVSFDIDPDSVAATNYLRDHESNTEHWNVMQGSALDREFLGSIEAAELVYSWGVLHHTGAMWQAVENVLPLVRPDGKFYLALYTTTSDSAYWTNVKEKYNRSSSVGKRLMEYWYVVRNVIMPTLRSKQNPVRYITEYKKSRGMEFMTDVRDWLGGWPYEDASVDEVRTFLETRNFRELRIRTGAANTEYLFGRSG